MLQSKLRKLKNDTVDFNNTSAHTVSNNMQEIQYMHIIESSAVNVAANWESIIQKFWLGKDEQCNCLTL